MFVHYLIIAVLLTMTQIPAFGQDSVNPPVQIASKWGDIIKAEISPDGNYITMLVSDGMSETKLEVMSTNNDDFNIRLMNDLTMFYEFSWSPNSQYIAAIGRRGNASGTEYALVIFDLYDVNGVDWTLPRREHNFREFVYSEDRGPSPQYAPQWSTDGQIIAINRRDGIHFYDLAHCEDNECPLVNFMNIGYVSWFDWQGDTLITYDTGNIKMWNVQIVSKT